MYEFAGAVLFFDTLLLRDKVISLPLPFGIHQVENKHCHSRQSTGIFVPESKAHILHCFHLKTAPVKTKIPQKIQNVTSNLYFFWMVTRFTIIRNIYLKSNVITSCHIVNARRDFTSPY